MGVVSKPTSVLSTLACYREALTKGTAVTRPPGAPDRPAQVWAPSGCGDLPPSVRKNCPPLTTASMGCESTLKTSRGPLSPPPKFGAVAGPSWSRSWSHPSLGGHQRSSLTSPLLCPALSTQGSDL